MSSRRSTSPRGVSAGAIVKQVGIKQRKFICVRAKEKTLLIGANRKGCCWKSITSCVDVQETERKKGKCVSVCVSISV